MTKHDIIILDKPYCTQHRVGNIFFSSHMSSNIKLGINFDNRITLYSSLINHYFVVCHVPQSLSTC